MIFRNSSLTILASVIGIAGCDGDKTPNNDGKVGTVSGRLEDGGMTSSTNAVRVESVGDDGKTKVIANGGVEADGSFEIEDVAIGNGPFVVRAVGASDATIAAAIVPEKLTDGGTVRAIPMNAETTVEVDALLAILAGAPAANNVDTIGLMTWISADLASDAKASAGGSAQLGAAFKNAQDAWLGTIDGQVDGASSASVQTAKLGAWGALTAALGTSTNAAARADAWADFQQRSLGDVRLALALDAGGQADAESAAGIVFAAQFEDGSAGYTDALKQAAKLSAYADWTAQHVASADASVATQVDAKLEVAYQTFLQAVAAAATEDAVAAASADLSASISGRGAVDRTTSALGILVAGESDDDVAAWASVESALDATIDVSETLRSAVAAAVAGSESARAAAVAAAYVTFRADLDAAVQGSLGSLIPLSINGFTSEVAAQSRAHLGAILEVDLLGVLGGSTLTLNGIVDGGLSLQDDGAIGLVADDTFDALTGAATAVLVSVKADGTMSDIASGTIDAGNHRFSFDAVTGADGTLLVELRDAAGAITGAAVLDGTFAGVGEHQVATITEESTVEAQVFLARLARGESTATIDRSAIELAIDAAVAGSVTTAADIQALASATFAAETVRSDALGTDRATLAAVSYQALATLHNSLREHADQADAAYVAFRAAVEASLRQGSSASIGDVAEAQADAALVFESVIEHRLQGSTLADVTMARSRLDAAFALELAVTSTFDGSSFGSVRETQLTTAVSTFVTATAAATSAVQLDVAAAAFANALLGFQGVVAPSTGVLGEMVQYDLALTYLQQPAIRLAVTNALGAALAYQTSLDAAVAAADGPAAFDATGFTAAWTPAATTLDSSLDTAIDFSSLTTVSVGDIAAMSTLVTHVALSFHGAIDGIPAN